MKIWERQNTESDKAFAAFQIYLDLGGERTFQKVAEKCQKTTSLINRWAREYNWRDRAVAWDNVLLEEKRRNYIQRYNKFLERQFKGNEKIQEMALKVFETNDMAKISWKSLNEIYRTNCTETRELAQEMGFAISTDSEITINIKPPNKETVAD